MTTTTTTTKTSGGKTVCGICGKDVSDKGAVKKQAEVFREMDGLFDRMGALFKDLFK